MSDISIKALMEQLLAVYQEHMPGERVTTDPRNVTPPCVLIEPPTLDFTTSALCGDPLVQFRVLVVGLNGAWAELGTLDALLVKVLSAPVAVLQAEPVAYEFGPPGSDPNQAYRLTLERIATS